MDVDGVFQEPDASEKRKAPHCSYCQNHGKSVSTRQHQCPYKDHNCDLCTLTKDAQTIMRHQQRFWRFMNQKLSLPKDRKGQLCDKCRNHRKIVSKSNHNCPYEKKHGNCTFCDLSNKRRATMKRLQKARRQGIVTKMDEESGEYVLGKIMCNPSLQSPVQGSDEETDHIYHTSRQNHESSDSNFQTLEALENLEGNKKTETQENIPTYGYQEKALVGKLRDLAFSPVCELSTLEDRRSALSCYNSSKLDLCDQQINSPPSLICPKAIRPRPNNIPPKSIYAPEKASFGSLSRPSISHGFTNEFSNSYIKSLGPPTTSRFGAMNLVPMQNDRHYNRIDMKNLRRSNGREASNSFPGEFPRSQQCLQSIHALHSFAMQERFPYGFPDPYLLRSFMPSHMGSNLTRSSILRPDHSLNCSPLSGLEGMTQMLHLDAAAPWYSAQAFRKDQMTLHFASHAAKFSYNIEDLTGASSSYPNLKL